MSHKISIELSDEIFTSLAVNGYSEKRLNAETKKHLAAGLYRLKVLSLGRASELADLNLWEFIAFLGLLEIPVVDYDEDEIAHEVDSSDWLLKNQIKRDK